MDVILLLFVFCCIAYGLKWLFIERLKVGRNTEMIVLVLFLLIISDDTLAILNFGIACTRTGSKIIERRSADGFYAPDWNEKQAKSYIELGYSYVETGDEKDGYFKYTHNNFERIERPQSSIEVESHTKGWGYKTSLFEANILDRKAHDVIAREAIAWTQGGYLLNLIRTKILLSNSHNSCRGPSDKADLNGNLVIAVIHHKSVRD